MMAKFKKRDFTNMVVAYNKPPRWNDTVRNYLPPQMSVSRKGMGAVGLTCILFCCGRWALLSSTSMGA